MKYRFFLFLFLISTTFVGQKASFLYAKKHLLRPSEGVILVTAHRGLHNDYPENSLASIKQAMEKNIDIIEVDVRVTKDGIPILMHDEEVRRTTGGKGKISRMDIVQVKQLTLLDKAGKDSGEKVPTLEQALKLGKNKIIFDLDLKVNNAGLKKVTEVIRENEASGSVIFYDSEYPKIRRVKKLIPSAIIMTKIHNSKRSSRLMGRIDPKIVHLGNSDTDREQAFIDNITNNLSRAVFANALGLSDSLAQRNPAIYDYFLEKDITVIQTDYPELLLRHLINRNKHQQF